GTLTALGKEHLPIGEAVGFQAHRVIQRLCVQQVSRGLPPCTFRFHRRPGAPTPTHHPRQDASPSATSSRSLCNFDARICCFTCQSCSASMSTSLSTA